MSTTPPDTPRMGRPSTYSPELGLAICQELAAGRSIREICQAEGLPDKSTVFSWLHRHPDFRAMYTAARELGAEAMGDEIIAMSKAAKPEEANLLRVQLEVTKWAAAVFAPKRWGSRVQAEVTGPDGRPVQMQAVPLPMVPREIRDGIKALLTQAEVDMGLPAGTGTDAERLKAIVQSGQVLSPDLYEALHSSGGADG